MNNGAHSSISSVSDKECLTTTSTATQQYGLDRDSNREKIRQYAQSPYNPCRKTEPTSKHINLEMPGHGSLEHTQNNTSNKNEMVNQSSRTFRKQSSVFNPRIISYCPVPKASTTEKTSGIILVTSIQETSFSHVTWCLV
jgi:hypothetical protein